MSQSNTQHDVAVYGGYLEDATKLLQSASGGIATALSEFMLQQGGCVVGVAFSKDFYRVEYVVVHDVSELDRLKGSKYIDCEKKNVYATVKTLLDSGRKVLFFGLPCVVGALYNYLGARHENLWTCELICHGTTKKQVHTDYIAHLERTYHSKVVEFSVRHKEGAWTPSYLRAKFENGHVFQKPFSKTEYGIAFSVLTREACYRCQFKGDHRQGDIMIGDFWGADTRDDFWNPYGVSSIFAETEKGDAFLKSTPGIRLFPTQFQRVVEKNPMVVTSTTRTAHRDRFAALLDKKGLIYAARHCISYKDKFFTLLSKCMPGKILKGLKKLLRK